MGWIITDSHNKIYLIFITLWTFDRYQVQDIRFYNKNV